MLYFVPAKSAFWTSMTDYHEAKPGAVLRELLSSLFEIASSSLPSDDFKC